MSSAVAIAVDCMGGDHGVAPIVQGALAALAQRVNGDLSVVLVGDRDQIQAELSTAPASASERIKIEHAPEAVQMHDSATQSLRRRDTSIAVCMRLHKEGVVEGVVSPGNTGAVMATALLTLQRMPGVLRPAIASLFPNPHSATVVLDVGANAECKPQHLLQFAIMGSSFSQLVLKHPRPQVGLLSIGEEATKGNEITQAAHRLLAADPGVNFIGNIEGRDVLSGEVQVVVTDGFVGNILLKFAESVGPLLETKLRHQINTNVFSRFGALLMKPFLRRLRNSLDYAEYGGAPLLGIEGVVIICHGKSGAKAIMNAIFEAEKSVRQKVNLHIKEHLKDVQDVEPTHAV